LDSGRATPGKRDRGSKSSSSVERKNRPTPAFASGFVDEIYSASRQASLEIVIKLIYRESPSLARLLLALTKLV
jgi:hypothetical protein